ncbi:acetyl-CoA carboxylase biotin carboxyl carrier protein [Sphingomonas jejuensis]|uniref:Biotin carboxyl carrier protein of acetyl-CoA carboxylase n=1 Tax=Sphingomonas jejuensis TaxID=904715 RepID=A0ABX0XKG1_9SPHN|nr:acetyl-CoA carboxylase biotin carboxyl carrier protein [Sphingomonas jejuensis]NJC33824.1 acetyl-CoA carboxylase biotin carboxyl carrier protein [Sphingomonas jejuensis]
MAVDAGLVRQLAELLDDTRLTEIEVQDGDRRIRVVRKPAQIVAGGGTAMVAAAPAAPGQPAAGLTPPSVDAAESTEGAIRSPMVGTAYLAAEPGSRPFVSVGDTVAAGDTLLIVEAMKVMNPIVAPQAGKVTRVLVDNGQPVEFDQPLIIVA